MKYKILYLPVDKPLEDGDTIINSQGEHFIYNEVNDFWRKELIRPAQLFLVSMEFNEMKIIGVPSREALKWMKAGMEIKSVDCVGETFMDNIDMSINYVQRIKCPICSSLH